MMLFRKMFLAEILFKIHQFNEEWKSVQYMYSKTCLKRPLKKKTKIGFQDQLSLNAGQRYCRMLPLEHSAILSTFIKLPYVIEIFVLSICEWLLKTGFNVPISMIEK